MPFIQILTSGIRWHQHRLICEEISHCYSWTPVSNVSGNIFHKRRKENGERDTMNHSESYEERDTEFHTSEERGAQTDVLGASVEVRIYGHFHGHTAMG